MSDDCIFCRIAAGSVPATVVESRPDAVAIRDTNPVAPVHVLVIPRRHIQSLDRADDAAELGVLAIFAADVARREGLVQGGYRLVVNTGDDAGQSVPHLHLHVLGGRKLAWPPG